MKFSEEKKMKSIELSVAKSIDNFNFVIKKS